MASRSSPRRSGRMEAPVTEPKPTRQSSATAQKLVTPKTQPSKARISAHLSSANNGDEPLPDIPPLTPIKPAATSASKKRKSITVITDEAQSDTENENSKVPAIVNTTPLILPTLLTPNQIDAFIESLFETVDARIHRGAEAMHEAMVSSKRAARDRIDREAARAFDTAGDALAALYQKWKWAITQSVFSVTQKQKDQIDSITGVTDTDTNSDSLEAEIAALQKSVLRKRAILAKRQQFIAVLESELSDHALIQQLFTGSDERDMLWERIRAIVASWPDYESKFSNTLEAAKRAGVDDIKAGDDARAVIKFDESMIDAEALQATHS